MRLFRFQHTGRIMSGGEGNAARPALPILECTARATNRAMVSIHPLPSSPFRSASRLSAEQLAGALHTFEEDETLRHDPQGVNDLARSELADDLCRQLSRRIWFGKVGVFVRQCAHLVSGILGGATLGIGFGTLGGIIAGIAAHQWNARHGLPSSVGLSIVAETALFTGMVGTGIGSLGTLFGAFAGPENSRRIGREFRDIWNARLRGLDLPSLENERVQRLIASAGNRPSDGPF